MPYVVQVGLPHWRVFKAEGLPRLITYVLPSHTGCLRVACDPSRLVQRGSPGLVRTLVRRNTLLGLEGQRAVRNPTVAGGHATIWRELPEKNSRDLELGEEADTRDLLALLCHLQNPSAGGPQCVRHCLLRKGCSRRESEGLCSGIVFPLCATVQTAQVLGLDSFSLKTQRTNHLLLLPPTLCPMTGNPFDLDLFCVKLEPHT